MPTPDPIVIQDYTVTPYGRPDLDGRFRWRLAGPGRHGGITGNFGHASRSEARDRATAWLIEQGLIADPTAPAPKPTTEPSAARRSPFKADNPRRLTVNPDALPGQCRIVGCTNRAKARGLCGKHYMAAKADGCFDQVAAPAKPHTVVGGLARQAQRRETERLALSVPILPLTDAEIEAALRAAGPPGPSEADRLREIIREATGLLSHVRLDEEPEDNAAGLVPRIRAALSAAVESERRKAAAEISDLSRSLAAAERGTDTLAALYLLFGVENDADLLAAARLAIGPAERTPAGWLVYADSLRERADAAQDRAEKLTRAAELRAEAERLEREAA